MRCKVAYYAVRSGRLRPNITMSFTQAGEASLDALLAWGQAVNRTFVASKLVITVCYTYFVRTPVDLAFGAANFALVSLLAAAHPSATCCAATMPVASVLHKRTCATITGLATAASQIPAFNQQGREAARRATPGRRHPAACCWQWCGRQAERRAGG
jgi:hypothetical protein